MGTVWAPIHHKNEDGSLKTFKPGDTVSEGDLAEGDYNLFKREGIIREQDFPKGVQPGEAVRTAVLRKAREDYEASTAIATPEAYSILDPAPRESETTDDDTSTGEREDDTHIYKERDINAELLGNSGNNQ